MTPSQWGDDDASQNNNHQDNNLGGIPRPTARHVVDEARILPAPSLAAEARILARLLVALVVGGLIGMERRAANSLAGVRTFSLVSLGAAVFMSTSLTAFPKADPTRVAAAISSSVGFLGAGAMHKNAKHSRGLTTASSVWLAAALGIAAAAGLFLLSFSGAVATVLIARYARFDSSLQLIRGQQHHAPGEDEDDDDDDGIIDDLDDDDPVQLRKHVPTRRRLAHAYDDAHVAQVETPVWLDDNDGRKDENDNDNDNDQDNSNSASGRSDNGFTTRPLLDE